MNIEKIKQTIKNNSYNLPSHWVIDWLLEVLAKPNSFLITDANYELTKIELMAFNKGINKMQSGTPFAQLIGKQAFWSLDFMVNEHTLIPRPDTEVLVETVLNWIKKHTFAGSAKLLDLGTGTGCIAISLAYELNKHAYSNIYNINWQITAVDISNEALAVAKQNIVLNKVDNVELIQSSWYGNLDTNNKFDVIVSNPPYINGTDAHLAKLKAEAITALVADNKGLADIEHIVCVAPNHLVNGGLLAVEHGYEQAKSVQTIFNTNGFNQVKTIKDYNGNDRVTIGVLA